MREPREAFSVLLNNHESWNQLVWRKDALVGQVSRLLRYPVCSRLPLKIGGRVLFALSAVPITASGLLGEKPLVNRRR